VNPEKFDNSHFIFIQLLYGVQARLPIDLSDVVDSTACTADNDSDNKWTERPS